MYRYVQVTFTQPEEAKLAAIDIDFGYKLELVTNLLWA